MSIQNDHDYIEKAKLEIQKLATLLFDKVSLEYKDVYYSVLDHEEDALYGPDDLSERQKQRLQAIRGARFHYEELVSAIMAFMDDAYELCEPSSPKHARVDGDFIVFDLEQPYEIAGDRIQDIESVRRWVDHLTAKSWATKESIQSFVRCVNQLKGWSYAIPEGEVRS